MVYYSGTALRYSYIATARYSKEERASLELGDTIYPYDRAVEVLPSDVSGVIVVISSLPRDALERLLSGHYLSAVEYVTYVSSCISCYKAPHDHIVEHVVSNAISSICFSKIRVPRVGSVDRELLNRVKGELSKHAVKGCSGIISLEIFGTVLCLGPVVYFKKGFKKVD